MRKLLGLQEMLQLELPLEGMPGTSQGVLDVVPRLVVVVPTDDPCREALGVAMIHGLHRHLPITIDVEMMDEDPGESVDRFTMELPRSEPSPQLCLLGIFPIFTENGR